MNLRYGRMRCLLCLGNGGRGGNSDECKWADIGWGFLLLILGGANFDIDAALPGCRKEAVVVLSGCVESPGLLSAFGRNQDPGCRKRKREGQRSDDVDE